MRSKGLLRALDFEEEGRIITPSCLLKLALSGAGAVLGCGNGLRLAKTSAVALAIDP